MKRVERKARSGRAGGAGRKAILVLGMHRSGTSAVARVLGLCGARLPSEPLPANESNETGYWEPEAVVRLHDEFLSANTSGFDDVTALPLDWNSSPLASAYASRLKEVLQETYGESPLWLVKDPRLCRLLPLWRPVLEDLQVAPLAVLTVRNPVEVAASLGKRDGFSLSKSLLLWLRHFLEAEAATRDIPRSFVLYESLLQDWRGVVGKVGRELGIEWPRPTDAAAPEVEAFLDATRRHHVSSDQELAARPDVAPWVWTVYRWAVKAARGEGVPTAALDQTREALAAADQLFPSLPADWQQDRIKLAETLNRLAQLVTEFQGLHRELIQTREGSAALRREHSGATARLAELQTALAQRDSELESMRTELKAELESAQAQARVELEATRTRHDSELGSMRTELKAELESTLARSRVAHKSALEAARRQSRAELEAAHTQHRSDLESAREQHQSELDSAREQHQSALDSARAEGRRDVEEMRRRWLAVRLELRSLQASVGWRLSKPFRWIAGLDVGLARALARPGRRRGRLRNPLRLWRQSRLLRKSGLFDDAWYLQENADVAASGLDPLTHYLCFGAAEGRDPNPVFSTRWYLRRNPDVGASRLNPLLHYSLYGAAEGRDPGPAFDTAWYRAQDADIARKDLNPLAHYLEAGRAEGRPTRPPEVPPEALGGAAGETVVSAEAFARQVLASPNAVDPAHQEYQKHDPSPLDVKAIAFYLPQFHPVPENDEWWGKGFTEWANVSRAVPQFLGHYQPRLPGELGFYDLRVPEVQRRQVELARNYGIEAFCFHFYWFGGKRLLERPLNQFLADPSLDIGFCLCWANENWSRRWDGSENEILIAQEHSPEDDQALIREMAGAFSDRRYLRVGGRPILVVYRVDLLPDARKTAERWRRHCRDTGIGEIVLVAAQTFGITDPRPYGFDAAVEFPPHGRPEYHQITGELKGINPAYTGGVSSYEDLAAQYERRTPPPYPLIRTVCPAWDNTARRLERGAVYHDSSPSAYRSWLEVACGYAAEHPIRGESLVFVNAWNEWGEGAYLEPDRRYGYAYLEATRSALTKWPQRSPASLRKRRIVLVTHNALNHGAQQIALHIARALNRHFRYDVEIIDCGLGHLDGKLVRCPAGKLTPLFQREGRILDFADDYPDERAREGLLRELRRDGVDLAICNSTVAGPVAATLKACGFRVVSLIHELASLVRECGLEDAQRAIAEHADTIVCASDLVRDAFLDSFPRARKKTLTRHQGLYWLPDASTEENAARSRVRARLELPPDARVVIGVGYADLRKGFDIFMRVAARLAEADDHVFIVWLGCEVPTLRHWAQHDAERLGFADRLRLLPRVDDVSEHYAAADLLLLPSREDPFPSVVLEALAHRVPVVAFEGATGAAELLSRGCGVMVPYGREGDMADAALRLLGDDALRAALGERGRALVARDFDWRDYLHFILEQLGERHHRVSVVVPNYNYAKYLPSRLESIFAQSYPVHEVIVLDDASTDDSVALVERLREEHGWNLTLIVNETNSGSVFQQWLKGAEEARGGVLWIAEADDHADPDFLARLLPRLDDPDVVLAYAQSRQIDEEGRLIAPDYLDYVKDIDPDKWTRSWVRDGRDELRDTLVVKNTIPNVSAALFRREALVAVLREHMGFIREFRVAGDHAAYVRLLARGGKIAFVKDVVSNHRRHPGSVTLKAFGAGLLREIGRVQTDVFDAVGATDEASAKADRYLSELYEQFGLSEEGASWREDPELFGLSRHPLHAAPGGIRSETPRWPLVELFQPGADPRGEEYRPEPGIVWLVLAITPRSGSTAFCSILEKTGCLGRPTEVFNPRGPAQCLLRGRRPGSITEFMDIVATECEAEGVVSFKTAWSDLRPLVLSGCCEQFLKACRWIYLDRGDLEQQAASLARARKSGFWHRKASRALALPDVSVSRAEVDAERRALEKEKSGWRNFFAGHGIQPVEILFEDMVANVEEAVDKVAGAVERPLPRRYDWSDSEFRRLR